MRELRGKWRRSRKKFPVGGVTGFLLPSVEALLRADVTPVNILGGRILW